MNEIRIGTVTEVDFTTAVGPRARVQVGTLMTDWLPLMQPRAGSDASNLAPSVGEQVVIAAPGGDPRRGIIIGSIPQAAHPAPAQAEGIHRTRYADGAVIEYDRTTHTLSASLPAGGTLTITAPGGLTITGDVTITGTLNATAVTAGTIDLATHVHGAVTAGTANSGAPQ